MSECIEWAKGRDKNGYGKQRRDGKCERAHRLVFLDCNGWMPQVVRHTCDNPPCVNPAHLLGGTHKDNVRDKYTRGRDNHVNGTKHGLAKLTPDLVYWIRSSDLLLGVIAEWIGVSESTVQAARRGRTWGHLGKGSPRRHRFKAGDSPSRPSVGG